MKTKLIPACVSMIVLLGTGSAYAATGSRSGGLGLGAIIFLGFLAAIVLLQLLPGLVLFGSLIAALFSKAAKKRSVAAAEEVGKVQ